MCLALKQYKELKATFKQDMQCRYKRNIDPRSYNHSCSGKAISITYSECVFVALGIQHSMRLRYVVIYGLCGFTVFFYILHKQHDFRKKKMEYEVCVLIFCTTLTETFSFQEEFSDIFS
jgi:hypothetical protein